ncbi:type II secretion system F family protein [Patescibacteria group bacterium]|nr:type II secretion system F family protein [Patescibacteria group bacterium]
MKFNYQARTKMGDIKTGVVEASTRDAAFKVLKSHGLYVTILEEASMPFYAKKVGLMEIITKKDIVIFSRQLAIMIKSKVPIVETLKTIAKQTRKHKFKDAILKIAEEVEGGSTLSKSFSLYSKLFSPFYINMIKSGEVSGKLSEIFLHLADYLEKEDAFRSKIRGAMIYPIFVIIVFIAVVGIIMIYVIPQLAEVLEGSDQELPMLTKIVMAFSDFLQTSWWLVLLVLGGIVGGFIQFARSEYGKDFFDRLFLKTPILKGFLKKLYLSRFALNLSTLISGGLPIVGALTITGEVVGNNYYKEVIFKTRDGVKRGEPMSSVLEKYPDVISPLFFQMIIAGEKTGSVDESLLNVVDFYEKDVERSLDTFVRLLEPIFIILLGGVVAGLMGAVLMPLYSGGMM